MMLLASTVDLIAIFVALELQAISFYVLVGFCEGQRGRARRRSSTCCSAP